MSKLRTWAMKYGSDRLRSLIRHKGDWKRLASKEQLSRFMSTLGLPNLTWDGMWEGGDSFQKIVALRPNKNPTDIELEALDVLSEFPVRARAVNTIRTGANNLDYLYKGEHRIEVLCSGRRGYYLLDQIEELVGHKAVKFRERQQEHAEKICQYLGIKTP